MRFLIIFLMLPVWMSAQITCGSSTSFQVLHFTKTSSFDHQTRNQSAQMFTEIGEAENFTIVNTQEQSAFDDLATLLNYEVIIFSNTTGNIPFTATQKMNLENYIVDGGSILGIHGASDMYRDASYPFFTKLIGGSRRNAPAHTSDSFIGMMDVVGVHESTDSLPDPWRKQEEYYYWPDTGLVAGIIEVLRVRRTGSESYNDARPISWYQYFPSGARTFYTALGHSGDDYTDSCNDFRQHLRDALCWCVESESFTLPVTLLGTNLERIEGLNRISWELAPTDRPSRVELHGGYGREDAVLLTSSNNEDTRFLEHHPADMGQWFYYRLRFLDEDGMPSWSEWISAAPEDDADGPRPQVQYGPNEAVLVVPAEGPKAAWIVDSSGRKVSSLQLVEGQNLLPALKPGLYFIRFPFGLKGVKVVIR